MSDENWTLDDGDGRDGVVLTMYPEVEDRLHRLGYLSTGEVQQLMRRECRTAGLMRLWAFARHLLGTMAEPHKGSGGNLMWSPDGVRALRVYFDLNTVSRDVASCIAAAQAALTVTDGYVVLVRGEWTAMSVDELVAHVATRPPNVLAVRVKP